MTAELKQAAQIALLALEYHTQQTRPITQTEEAIKVLMEALAAHRSQAPAEGDAEFHQLGCLKGMLEDDEGARHSCTCGAKTSPTRDQLFTALNEVAELVGDCEEWAITEDPQVVVGMVKDYMAGVALSKAQPKGAPVVWGWRWDGSGQYVDLTHATEQSARDSWEGIDGGRVVALYADAQAPAPAPEPVARVTEFVGAVRIEAECLPHAGALMKIGDMLYAVPIRAPAVTHGWRPIETAPKDGTAILAFWKPIGSGPIPSCYGITQFVEGRWRNPDEDDDYFIDPTHWTPLPAAPELYVPVQGSGQ